MIPMGFPPSNANTVEVDFEAREIRLGDSKTGARGTNAAARGGAPGSPGPRCRQLMGVSREEKRHAAAQPQQFLESRSRVRWCRRRAPARPDCEPDCTKIHVISI